MLRWVACIAFAACCYMGARKGEKLLPWVYLLAAIVFNPLVKVRLPKEAWMALDVAAGALLLLTARRLR